MVKSMKLTPGCVLIKHSLAKLYTVSSYYAFHTRLVGPGVKGIIEMHRFNICLVVVLSLSCSGVKAPLFSHVTPPILYSA